LPLDDLVLDFEERVADLPHNIANCGDACPLAVAEGVIEGIRSQKLQGE
jgi:hypothetical protein